MNAVEKIKWIQARACSLHINFNDNRGCYRTVADEVKSLDLRPDDFASPEVMTECIEKDQLVSVQCYPSTPIGSYTILHHDLEAAVATMFEWVEPELRDK